MGGDNGLRVIVIGAGFAGACAAFLLRERYGASVTLLERALQSGGMLRTLYTHDGLPYEYGPRVLSVFRGTASALDFLGRFLDLEERDIYQGTRLQPDYPVIPFPVDRESLMRLPCGARIRDELSHLRHTAPDEANLRTYLETTVGPTLTRLVFAGFNRKFWGRELDQLPASWGKLRRLERIAEAGSYRLPSVAPHYYPKGGFNPLFEQLLNGFTVHYGALVRGVEAAPDGVIVHCEGVSMQAELVIATGPIDELLGHAFGPLEWKGYRLEIGVATRAVNGRAPDGVPFAWLYTPWEETPVCRRTDFGVIHHGRERRGAAVVLEEIPDDRVRMYPVWWEEERFDRYLAATAQLRGLIPLGRLGLYKYVTTDSTFGMIERLLAALPHYHRADATERFQIFKQVRGDWSN
jgi:UDP-galactopyranose mutase